MPYSAIRRRNVNMISSAMRHLKAARAALAVLTLTARISAISLAIFSVISLGAAEEAEGQAAAQ